MSLLKTRILTVEDDESLAKLILELMVAADYDGVHFSDANAAIEWLKTHKVDLILSDIGLPGLSGMQFCKLLKENVSTSSVPIIMLTAAGDEKHKVEALKTGADDYVVKPFSAAELLARIESLLRRYRYHGQMDRVLGEEPLTVNLDTGIVEVKKKKLDLNLKEYALLVMFLKRKGRILTYSFIADDVWGDDSIATKDTIKVTMHRLRAKLGELGSCIEAVPGQGYRWQETK
ncbi:MAG: response regulator transcription factor [Elusimicrobia bacterium]|nr:response regulator transcription factor [Elusimicrobiota bacterium]